MSTVIRPEVSKNSKYWIDKHRHYELKHFCLQYPYWKRIYKDLTNPDVSLSTLERIPSNNLPSDPTAKRAMLKAYYSERIKMIEDAAKEADKYIYEYILKAVTEGHSYVYMKTKYNIPCGKDMYYDRYRKFLWLLNGMRG